MLKYDRRVRPRGSPAGTRGMEEEEESSVRISGVCPGSSSTGTGAAQETESDGNSASLLAFLAGSGAGKEREEDDRISGVPPTDTSAGIGGMEEKEEESDVTAN